MTSYRILKWGPGPPTIGLRQIHAQGETSPETQQNQTTVNSLVPGSYGSSLKSAIFKPFHELISNFVWGEVNIGPGNGLVPSGNKQLPEPMLTKIDVTICHQLPTMSEPFTCLPH